jgi:hypothetical protein
MNTFGQMTRCAPTISSSAWKNALSALDKNPPLSRYGGTWVESAPCSARLICERVVSTIPKERKMENKKSWLRSGDMTPE